MDSVRIDLDQCQWDYASPGMRVKCAARDGRQLRLVEIGPDFGEADWCEVGHAGYVLEGDLEIQFEDTVERLSAGDGLLIPQGEKARHKSRAVSGVVRLILVEDT